jgi:uncharacterized protein (DUF169 family)
MTERPQTISTDHRWTQASARLVAALDLSTEPVGVWLIRSGDDLAPFAGFDADDSLRFCQALMRARRAEAVLLTPPRLTCPAAARAFGFRALPPALERLRATAIPRSRAKKPYELFEKTHGAPGARALRTRRA